jgi:type I restriction enzyme, S subunit
LKSKIIFESVSDYFGKISNDRKIVKLSDVCSGKKGVLTGPFGSQLHKRDYVENGIPIMTVEHLRENEIIHENLPKVSKSDYDRLSKYILEEGDIVFSRVGSVDRSSIVRSTEKSWLFSGRCLRVRPNNQKIISDYLSWFFQYSKFKEYIRKIAVGAVMPSLNTKLMENIEIILPSIEQQKKISVILNSIHNEIHYLKKQNKVLEIIIQQIFKAWFLNLNIQKKNDLKLMNITKIWNVSKFSEHVKIIKGKKPQNISQIKQEGEIPHILIETLDKGISNYTNPENLVTCKETDTIMVMDGASSGRISIGNYGVVGSTLAKIIPKENMSQFYIYHTLKNIENKIKSNVTGSAIPHADKNFILESEILIPDKKTIKNFERIAIPINQIISNKKNQINTLKEIQKKIIPKLMSGEIRV